MWYSIYQNSIASVSKSELKAQEAETASTHLTQEALISENQVKVLLGAFPGQNDLMANGLSASHFGEWYFK